MSFVLLRQTMHLIQVSKLYTFGVNSSFFRISHSRLNLDDILRARLCTIGVEEHRIKMETSTLPGTISSFPALAVNGRCGFFKLEMHTLSPHIGDRLTDSFTSFSPISRTHRSWSGRRVGNLRRWWLEITTRYVNNWYRRPRNVFSGCVHWLRYV